MRCLAVFAEQILDKARQKPQGIPAVFPRVLTQYKRRLPFAITFDWVSLG
ncbi:MAG: hypothetical protein IKB20_01975 [Clostridia bacterium]|nr:hypothetical protein [Clostridia bacterium]